jgi:pyrroloquinoline quinone (PQQ) biosynthesis protein C
VDTDILDTITDAETETETAPVESRSLREELFTRLDASITQLWVEAEQGPFWRHVTEHGFDRRLYALTMAQIYHYTRHNSVNQAIAALHAPPEQIGLLRFIYSHAREELGHEKLVLHDLRAVGLLEPKEVVTDEPLPATDALINYIYSIALREGPIPRLGYSYWAESVYEHIAPLLDSARRSMGLTDREMAFFVAHAEIDTKHAEEVKEAIQRAVTTQEQADAVHRVAVTTLWLTIELLNQAYTVWSRQPAAAAESSGDGR